jgi:hypothetical protein
MFSKVLPAKTQLTPSVPAEHRLITNNADQQRLLLEELSRPIVVVNKDPRYVSFWKAVCSEGKGFTTLVQIGEEQFQSPWAMLGFKCLHNALILSEAAPVNRNLDLLEMQEALDDYVEHHGLFAQAKAASRLASRLPWLVKYKFVEFLPLPIHATDLDRGLGLQKPADSLPEKDVTFQLPDRYIIGTLLIAGHMMETHFNHWITENLDLKVAYTSLGGAFREMYAQWETESRTFKSPRGDFGMEEINKIGEFLGEIQYTQKADTKFRAPGVNTSFWEAALAGPVPHTAAEAVLAAQHPNPVVIGGSVLSVSSKWFAKIRASNLLSHRTLEEPYDDFPFPVDIVPVERLTETEQRLAYAQTELPQFELAKIQFGPYRLSSFQKLLSNIVPTWPRTRRMMGGGRFEKTFLRLDSEEKSDKPYDPDASTEAAVPLTGWQSIDGPIGGDRVLVEPGNDSALRAFVDALRGSGVSIDLEDVKEIATSRGWDQATFARMRDLGNLCDHFNVQLDLESEVSGPIRYHVNGASTSIHLVYMGKLQFAWVRGKTAEEVEGEPKGKQVKFT